MRKWPKHVCLVCAEDPALAESCPDEDKAEVIPADLGRELYEELLYEITRQGGPLLVEERRRADSALARYEREVGK